jgi:hypothetical protein
VISLACRYATGKELQPCVFSGGVESNNFLSRRGFTIGGGNIDAIPPQKARLTR